MQRGNLEALVSGCAERREIAEKYCGLLFAAAGVEKPTAEQAAALAAAGVDLTGNPVADILARPVSSPVWDWTKRGVSFPSAETIQAERERLLKESSALLDNRNGLEAKAAEIPEAREMVETMRRAVESAANVLMAGVETWQTEAEILQLVTLAVAKVRRLATDAEIEAARERLAAFLAPPSAEPSPPAAAEPSEPAAKRKRGPNFDFTQAQLDAAAAYRDARRKKLDRDGKPAPYLSREDCTLWRWFCNWRRKYPRNDSTLRGAKEIENARALRAALKRLPPLP